MAAAQTITGGSCFCKKVTYQFEGQPAAKSLCHCGSCKHLSSSLFAMHLHTAPDKFKIKSGEPKIHTFQHPSGLDMKGAFCSDCGTWLYKQVEVDPWRGFYLVQAGTTDLEPGQEAKGFWADPPVVELWVSERAPWVQPVKGAEQKAQF